MSDLVAIRQRGDAHQAELDRESRFLTLGDLAKRWALSVSAVRDIPRDELPYMEFGSGAKHKHRRYTPEAVTAYEATR